MSGRLQSLQYALDTMTKNSTFSTEWLSPIQIPLATKFVRSHQFRGRIRSHDQCIVLRNQQADIVGIAALRAIGDYHLLTAVAIVEEYRGQGLARKLLYDMNDKFSQDTFTFSLCHLQGLYSSVGFIVVSEQKLPSELNDRFTAYQDQGRDIIPMVYRPN